MNADAVRNGTLCLVTAMLVPGAAAQNSASDILNKSLSSVGKCVVVTVSSAGAKDQAYHAQIPGDKYSMEGDNTPMSLIEVTKRINAAIDKAKKRQESSTITITVETKVPTSK